MKLFYDAKRRVKQQVYEKVGLAAGTEDSDFEAEYAEYKGTVNSIRHLQATMRAQGLATKKLYQTSAALSVELAAFHRGTVSADGAMALGQAHAELERVQLAAIERLYEEEVIAAADLLLWQVPEVQERVKQRKKLLLDYNSYLRKYEASSQALAEAQNSHGAAGGGFFGRAKTESDLTAEVATRKVKLEHAEAAVQEATEWCLTQFRALLDQRESGQILGGPMAAFLSCQRKLMSAGAQKLDRVRPFLPLSEKFDETLATYETEFAKIQAAGGNDLFANFGGNLDINAALNGSGDDFQAVFGNPLPENCPSVIQEAIEYLEANGGFETEGLFRIPGNQDMVQELRDRYNAGETNVFELLHCDPHDVAALIKRFLQELPESLIPQSFYQQIVNAARANDDCETLSNVIGEMPDSHLRCLFPLLKFLHRLARRSDLNKMTFTNLATCLAPTVVRAPQDESPIKIMNEMQHIIVGFKTLIEHAKRFTLEPAPMNSAPRIPRKQAENRPPLPNQSPYGEPVPNKHTSMRPQSSGKGASMLKRMSMRRSASNNSMTMSIY